MKVQLFFNQNTGKTNVKFLQGTKDFPAGWCSDLGSIPQILWSWCNPYDARWAAAFGAHDWAYITHRKSRKEADEQLLQDLQAAGMRFSQRWAIYLAVRAFGGFHWD